MDFDVLKFESVADQADECDIKESCTLSQALVKSLKNISRPYLASAGIEDGIQYIHTMNPLMSKVLARAEFLITLTFFKCFSEPKGISIVIFPSHSNTANNHPLHCYLVKSNHIEHIRVFLCFIECYVCFKPRI